jgi:hypothetical protein
VGFCFFSSNSKIDLIKELLNPEITVALSIILTIAVTILLLKVDLGKVAQRLLGKRTYP